MKITLIGNGSEGFPKHATSYRQKYPHDRLEIFYLPPSINRTFFFMNFYDPKFGDASYECTWNKNFNHSDHDRFS